MNEAEQNKKPVFWRRLVGLLLILAFLASFLRLFGALNQWPTLMQFGMTPAEGVYLIGQSSLIALLNLIAWFCLHWVPALRVAVVWTAGLMTISAYWFERLFLWDPSQRDGNWLFVLAGHALWVLVLILFTLTERKGSRKDG